MKYPSRIQYDLYVSNYPITAVHRRIKLVIHCIRTIIKQATYSTLHLPLKFWSISINYLIFVFIFVFLIPVIMNCRNSSTSTAALGLPSKGRPTATGGVVDSPWSLFFYILISFLLIQQKIRTNGFFDLLWI